MTFDEERIIKRVELIGLDCYHQSLQEFKRLLPEKLKIVKKTQTQRSGLHSLKGMCYSIGLEPLGNHIAAIEQMIVNGAHITADMHIQTLDKSVIKALESVYELIDCLNPEDFP
jgi:hypothetical protein